MKTLQLQKWVGLTSPEFTKTDDEDRYLEEPDIRRTYRIKTDSFSSKRYYSRFEKEETPEPRIRLQLSLAEVSHSTPDQRVIRHVDVEFWEAGDGGRNPCLGVKCLDIDEEGSR